MTPENHKKSWTDAEIMVVGLIGQHSIDRAARLLKRTPEAVRIIWRTGVESFAHWNESPEPDEAIAPRVRQIFKELRLRTDDLPTDNPARKPGISGENRPLGSGRMLADLFTTEQWGKMRRLAQQQNMTETLLIVTAVEKGLEL